METIFKILISNGFDIMFGISAINGMFYGTDNNKNYI